MDNLFDRAQDLIDKAHEKVASTASQAAFVANQSLVVRQLESHITAIDGQIDSITRTLGEQTYAAWRASGGSPDMGRVAALCNQLDGLKVQREEAATHLTAARSAAYAPNTAQWTPPALPAAPASPTSSPPTTSPSNLYVPPPAAPYAPPTPQVGSYSPATPAPAAGASTGTSGASAPASSSTQWSTKPSALTQSPVVSVSPVAVPPVAATYRVLDEPPTRAAHECPNCGHFVPGDAHFCPSCGAKVA